LVAALRILLDVIVFRVRRLEMANLAGAVAIMAVLRLPLGEALVRTLFAVVLNALVYLNNDYVDVDLDAQTPDKDRTKVMFLQAHKRQALLLQWALFAVLVAIAAVAPGLWLALALGAGVCIAYSKWLKHVPGLDVLAMGVWGFAMPLCGAPLDRSLGLLLALQLGLMSAVFETIQVIRDYDADRAAGVRTTAVVLGKPASLWLARGLMLASALYAALVLHPLAGVIAAGALLVPLRESAVDSYWTRIKLISGVAWLCICALTFLTERSHGVLLSVHASDTTSLFTQAAGDGGGRVP
jgi:4-hydroxybenzoate polyprenyltransferase